MGRTTSIPQSIARCSVEALEGRRLLSGTPVPVNGAPEFQVNQTTAGIQSPTLGDRTTASDAQGNFVVAWTGYGGSTPLYARRYDAAGNAQGGEFAVSAQSGVYSTQFSVGMNGRGDWVAVWTRRYAISKNSYGYDVRAQRFDPSGNPVGGELTASSTTYAHNSPTVGVADDGSFVVAWARSSGSQKEGGNVYAQRFSAAGAKVGGEFRVNDYLPDEQAHPTLTVGGAGNFVVAWQSLNQDGSDYGIFAKRYNASGAAVGGEFPVNGKTAGRQNEPSAALLPDGGFVVAWNDGTPGVSGSWDVRLRRFDAAGAGAAEQIVNTNTAGDQEFPKVAADAQGNATVVWWDASGQDGSGYGVFGQQYDPAGQPGGSEFRLSSQTSGDQASCFVAAQPDGRFAAVWDSYGQDGDSDGVYARLFQPPPTTSSTGTVTPTSIFSSTPINGATSSGDQDDTSLAVQLLG